MKRKKQRISKAPVAAFVETFSHDGRGIARIAGKTTFIEGALPNEQVMFQYTRKKREFDEGRVLSVTEASPHRVVPPCPYDALCGGCALQHLDGPTQIHEKEALMLNSLQRFGRIQPDTVLPPLCGELWHYRQKARLSVRYLQNQETTVLGFREKNNPANIVSIEQCLILDQRVSDRLPQIHALLNALTMPHVIAQIEVAAGESEVALIFRHLEALPASDLEKMKHFAQQNAFRIFLQPEGLDSVALFYPEEDSPYLTYSFPEEGLIFRHHPTDFTQVNAALNQKMVQQALALLSLTSDDVVLDLFCGLGNFSLPMATRAAQVIGVEGSSTMVQRAYMNAQLNGIENVEFLSMNLDDELALKPLIKYSCSKVLLDPPRIGALNVVKQMHKLNPQRIVYVSCNPVTLARDTEILVHHQGYKLVAAGVMDMFPHTAHVESIALFERT